MPQANARRRTARQSLRHSVAFFLASLRASLPDGQRITWSNTSGAKARNFSASNQWARLRNALGCRRWPSSPGRRYAAKDSRSTGISGSGIGEVSDAGSEPNVAPRAGRQLLQ